MTPTNRTQAFLGPEWAWPGVGLELEEVQSRQGRRRIFLYGTGHTVVQIVSPEWQEQRYEFRLTQPEACHLRQLCLEHDLMTIKPANQLGQPDEAELRLRLIDTHGWSHYVYKRAGVADARFDAICTELQRLAERTQSLESTYQGRFDSVYRPNRGWAGLAWSIRHRVEAVKALEVRDIAKIGLEIAMAILNLWYLFVLAIGLLILAFFWVEIDPVQTYGFGSAVLHGFFWVQNGLLSWFTGRYMWAPLNTGGWYRTGFIIGAVVLPFVIRTTIEVIVGLVREREDRRLRHQQAVHDILNRRY